MANAQMPKVSDNSNAAKEAVAKEKAKKPPVTTKAKLANRNLAMKFADVFFEGSIKDAIDYIINDVAIPQVKNAALRGLEVIFYGTATGSSVGKSSGSSQTPYNSYFIGRNGERRQNSPAPSGPKRISVEEGKALKRFDPRLIVVEDRGEAQKVLLDIQKQCNDYDRVSVMDLFYAVGITSVPYTADTYGWVKGDLNNASVKPAPGGWRFDLPDPYPID